MSKPKYTVKFTTQFKKDYKQISKQGLPIQLLNSVINQLSMGIPLPTKNKDHTLSGNWNGYQECHVQPDWLLIYRVDDNILVLTLTRTGTHSELFGK